jgi:hypothetical protein
MMCGLIVTSGAEHGDDQSVSSDDCSPTPLSQSSNDDDTASLKPSMKRYQPTVEDYDEAEDDASESESQTPIQDDTHQPLSRTSSQLSSSSSTDSTFSSPGSQSSYSTTASSPPPSESKEPRVSSPRPTVHFSEKAPPVKYYIPEPPEPEPELEPEPEVYQAQSQPSHLRPPVPEIQTPSYVDLKWGPLFNERDEPTPALGRFLRGLANHIVSKTTDPSPLIKKKIHRS